jgi:hypothetical protein
MFLDIGVRFLVVTVIAVPLAIILIAIRWRRFQNNFPAEERKQQLISAVAQMKREGRKYADRLAYLQAQGLNKDVADVLLGEAERSGK